MWVLSNGLIFNSRRQPQPWKYLHVAPTTYWLLKFVQTWAKSARHQSFKKRDFSLFFLVSVILQRVLVSSSPNAYGFIFFSFSVLVHPYQVHLSHTTFFIYIYIYILRCALCFCEFCAFVYPTKRKEFSVLVFIQGCALSSWRKIGLFSESFHVITWSLVSFHDFFVWVLFILFFLSVLDKFLWICLYFFDGRWLCSLRCVNILVRRAVKFFWIILELVGKFWSLFKF
jgi:hypothetical protein